MNNAVENPMVRGAAKAYEASQAEPADVHYEFAERVVLGDVDAWLDSLAAECVGCNKVDSEWFERYTSAIGSAPAATVFHLLMTTDEPYVMKAARNELRRRQLLAQSSTVERLAAEFAEVTR